MSDTFMRAALVLIFCYGLALGATFTGTAFVELRWVSLALLSFGVLVWLYIRWRRGWHWYATALDNVFLLWGVVFGLSLLANNDVWRRVLIGLWFVGLYVLVWYVLHDSIANRGIRRDMLADALLFSGLVVLFFAYFQVWVWLRDTDLNGSFALPRPVSVLGNANTLGAFLVILLPFILGRLMLTRARLGQIALVGYGLLAAAMLFLTFSRGGWIGTGAGLAVWVGLLLWSRGLLQPHRLRDWWGMQRLYARLALLAGGVTTLIMVAGVSIVLVRSLSVEGRDIGLRTYLFEAALVQFMERPLTGYGLFTFGRHLPRFASMPDVTPHTHAHNAPLHIAAELGLPGIIALVVTLVVLLRAIRRNLRDTAGREQGHILSAAAAVIAFGVHHMLDVPAMLPAIALVGLVALVGAAAPASPALVSSRGRRLGNLAGVVTLAALLVSGGIWSTSAYTAYTEGLAEAHSSRDYRRAAGIMQAAIDAEPYLSLYQSQQAFLLGMAANTGDLHAGLEASGIYERLVEAEPYYAPYRANLGMLLWNTGQQAAGLHMLQSAAEQAAESWQLQYDVALYAEALADSSRARRFYERALQANPDADLHPAWGQTSLQAMIRSEPAARSAAARVAALLAEGQAEAALALWEAELSRQSLTSHYVLRALIASALRDEVAAVTWLADAARALPSSDAQAWLYLGAAQLARDTGDDDLAAASLTAAQQALMREPLAADFAAGGNVAYTHFMRQGIARQFLPQVYYPTADPVLLYLLNRVDNQR